MGQTSSTSYGQTSRQRAMSSFRGSVPTTVWDRLTDELVVHIFSFLDLKEICLIIPQVSNRFKRISENEKIWKSLYRKAFSTVYIDENSGSFKYLFMIEVLDGKNRSQRYITRKKPEWCCEGGGEASQDTKFIRFSDRKKSARDILHQGAKLVILGDVSTGKTSILVRLVKGQFISYHDATIGASFLTKQLIVNDTPVKFEIWDTAGSERYYSLAPMYYRGAVAAIVVYDITHEESYERAIKWVSEVDELEPKPIIALIGNKSDLTKTRTVKKSEASTYAAENKLLFSETSAKTGEGVVEIFVQIAKLLIAKADNEDKEKQPRLTKKG